MSLSNTFENDLMKLIFQNTDITTIGDAGGLRGSAAAGFFYVALHTADPGEAGDQSTNEINYATYARVYTTRGSTGWTVATSTASNAIPIIFSACTTSGSTAAYVSVGTSGGGTGKILWSGALGATLVVTPGVQPFFTTAGLACVTD